MKFTKEQNREFWNEFAKKSRDNPFGAHTDRHVVELENLFLVSELESIKPTSLLDIGCGNGQRTLMFSKYVNGKTLGLDYSEIMIEEAKKLLSKQDDQIKNKISFENLDINEFEENLTFDVIISCRCFINQTSHEDQLKLFRSLFKRLNPGGSLLIAEQSAEGIERLNLLRHKHGLEPIKVRWNNLHISESDVLSKINDLFDIKKINRLGMFYYITRVIHPDLVYPEEPNPDAKINDMGLKAEIIFQESDFVETNLERFGAQLLIHFIKKE